MAQSGRLGRASRAERPVRDCRGRSVQSPSPPFLRLPIRAARLFTHPGPALAVPYPCRPPRRSLARLGQRPTSSSRFGTGLRGPSAARIRRPSGPRGCEPPAPASGPRASVAVAGRASRRLPGRYLRKLSVPDAGSQAVRYPCGQCPAGHASRQPQRLPVAQSAATGAVSVPGTIARLRSRRCAVEIETLTTCPGPFAGCRTHCVVATAPRHAMPISESSARLRLP